MSIIKTNDGFSIAGDVTFDNVVALRDHGIDIISHQSHCIIDLQNMKNTNAVSIALLLAWIRAAHHSQTTITLTQASQNLHSMIEAFNLQNIAIIQPIPRPRRF